LFKFLLGLAVSIFLILGQETHAGIAPLSDALSEKVMGRADAPVTIIEYSSLACPHCAAFHAETLPKIKKAYIDTGKVRLVYRDMPFGTPALAAAMLARCGGTDRYFGFIEVLFRSQPKWSRSTNPLDELTRVARFGGMSKNDVDQCLQTQDLLNAIRDRAEEAQRNFDITGTPTFLIEGSKIGGNAPYEDFKKVIEDALSKKR